MTNPNMGRAARNKNNVPDHVWSGWTNRQRGIFNKMYHEMRPSRQFLYLPASVRPLLVEEWNTYRRNVAISAADVCG